MAKGIKAAEKTVTSAGTAEAISTTIPDVSSAVIRAKPDNTSTVWVGDSTVSSSSNNGLAPGAFLDFGGDKNTGAISMAVTFVDSAVSGEGVDLWYLEADAS